MKRLQKICRTLYIKWIKLHCKTGPVSKESVITDFSDYCLVALTPFCDKYLKRLILSRIKNTIS